jgi:2-hydroxy-6-oxonona-2,4-dienedioate hydrolase
MRLENDWKAYDDQFIEIEGINTRYWEAGSGDNNLLFIHGFGGAAEEWIFNMFFFEESFHLFAIDLPGHGRSDKPDISYDVYVCEKIVNGFVDTLNITTVTFIGHSLCGAVALLYSIRHPERIDKIVLIAPSCIEEFGMMFRVPTIPMIGEMIMRPPSTCEQVEDSLKILTYKSVKLPFEIIERVHQFYNSPGYTRGCLSYMRNFLNVFGLTRRGKEVSNFIRNHSGNVENPILLFWGKHDRIVPMRYGADLKECLKNLEYHEIEECGHNPHWENAEEINTNIIDWLSG